MPAAEQPVSDEAASCLRLILERCQSIESIVLNSPTRGRTFDLTRKRILHHLIPVVRQYADELLDLHGLSTSPGDVVPKPLDAHCRPRVEQFRKHFLEVIHLFKLLQACDSPSDFDELDTCYAEAFIVNEEPSHNPREAINHHRVSLEMAHLLQVGSLDSQATEAAMEEALSNLITLMHEQSSPRYIHKYPVSPPYQWDYQNDPVNGSYGIIRKATSEYTGDVVAIKTINYCFDPEDRLKVAREIGAVEVCDHPNLIQLIDAYETADDTIHLVLKPWAPFTLHMFLAQSEQALARSCPWFLPGHKASMDTVLASIFCGLADGMNYLHLKSIKHKDIKPENILLHREGHKDVRPIIADFGASKVYKTGGRTMYADSTYTYLAPEQVNHTGSNLKSDVWQLGCCFAKILTRACGGYSAIVKLNDTYKNPKCRQASSIAVQLVHFLPKFQELCASMPDVLKLICGMLEEDPAMRWAIVRVRSELVRVLEERFYQK